MENELTVEQVADMLNVSPKMVGELLTLNRLEGLSSKSVDKYIELREKERDEALTEMTRLSQELGLY